ncbi:hypothetical protein Bca4012_076251 [Brassica carinata]
MNCFRHVHCSILLIAICLYVLTCSLVFVFRLEENEKLVLTPFEKNLDIWRQFWRVLERSDLIVMVVDARDVLVPAL